MGHAAQSGPLLSRRRFLLSAGAAGGLVLAAGCGTGRVVAVSPPGPFTVASFQTAVAAPPSIPAQLDAVLSRLVRLQAFSGVAHVAQGDRVLLSKGYGWADIAKPSANQADTRLPIASLTKPFTAMAVLQLQDISALHVRDRVALHLHKTPPAWKDITLHQLLTHTSGIPDYVVLPGFDKLATAHPTPEQLIDLFRAAPLNFVPGTRWQYCNSDYVLLGHVIERVSGLSYGEFLRRHIFQPVGMPATAYDTRAATAPAQGYAAWGQAAPTDDPATLFAAGGLCSTAPDLYRWHRALVTRTPPIASAEAISAMFTPYAAADNPGGPQTAQGYGYGWFIDTAVRRRRFWVPGAIDGFVSYAALYPDSGLSVIVLCNLASSDVRSIGETLAAMVL